MEIQIDPDFKALIPPLSSDELALLEANIVRDGCREPLMIWNGILADGHNRFEICTRLGLPYQTNYLDLPDRESTEIWIIENQLGRRNLENIDKVPLLERKRTILSERAKERQQRKPGDSVVENFTQQTNKTRDTLAAELGVSGPTYDALRTVSIEGTDELKQAVRDRRVGASTAAEIAHLPDDEQREIAALPSRKEIVNAARKAAPGDEYTAPDAPAPPKLGKVAPDLTGQFLPVAILHIDRIRDNDVGFEKAMEEIIAHCQKRLAKRKN